MEDVVIGVAVKLVVRDVAGVVAFLASKDASFITAETIQVGGGQALGI